MEGFIKMGNKLKRFLITYNIIYNTNHSVATEEIWAENKNHAESLFKRNHDSNGTTYQILTVEELK
jgi:hypothetical protein